MMREIKWHGQTGALHIIGIFVGLLLLGLLYVLSAWSHEVGNLRYEVRQLEQKVDMLDMRVKNMEGKVIP